MSNGLAVVSAAMFYVSPLILLILYTTWGAYGWRFWAATGFILGWIAAAAGLAKAGGVGE